MSGKIEIDVTDNSAEVLAAMKEQVALALEAIGGQAESYAKAAAPVDTGRLRNSITFATSTAQGSPNTDAGASADPSDYAQHGSAEENEVIIGTNVEYAPEQEYYGRHAHFLRDSVTNHGEDFKKIVEAALRT